MFFNFAMLLLLLVTLGIAMAAQHNVELTEVFVGVTDSTGSSRSHLTNVLLDGSVATFSAGSSDGEHIDVEFALTRDHSGQEGSLTRPHQAFVSFKHNNSDTAVVFVAKKLESSSISKLQYGLKVSLGEEIVNFVHLSGVYTITILIGDAAISSPIEQLVGRVNLKFPAKQVVNFPLYAKSLLHNSDVTLRALPEIFHLMRPAAKQAGSFTSTLFTGLAVCPLLVFVGFLIHLKPNLRRMSSLSSILLTMFMTMTLLLYVGYWLALDGFSFYETIKYLCFIFPFTIFVGKHALSSVTANRREFVNVKVK